MMKKIGTTLLIALFAISCQTTDDENTEKDDCVNYDRISHTSIYVDPLIYSEYTPIEIPKEKIGELISFEAPFEVEKAGKIYIKDDLIIIGEKEKGFHFYDNSTPSNPVQTKYLKTGPTSDIAIRDNSFYLNQYNDLVTLKVDTDNYTFTETGREKEVFNHYYYKERVSPDGYYFQPSENKIIVGFTKKENFKRPKLPEYTHAQTNCFNEKSVLLSDSSGGASDGQGGSFATFTLKGDYLYTVDQRKLTSFLIEGAHQENPSFVNTVNVGFGIETLFGFGENLFIGSNNAMYIYGLENPESPDLKSVSNHFRACDPVVANETNAFVTIRGGSRCGGNSNQLKVYDILDVENPILLLDKNLIQPKGLALYGKYVFVADTAIRVFDISDIANGNISLVTKIDQNVNDLIIRDNHMFAIGDTGIFQYALENTTELNITTLSEITF